MLIGIARRWWTSWKTASFNSQLVLSMCSILCSPSSFRRWLKLDVKYLCITAIAIFVVPASAFEGRILITGNAEIAGTITITCSWTTSSPKEGLNHLQVKSPSAISALKNPFYYIFSPAYSWASFGGQHHNRMFYEPFNEKDLRAIVQIKNLHYSDEKNYSCYFAIGRVGLPIRYQEETTYLAVKARSSTPSIILTPSGITDIKESSNISAFCATNVCQPGRGILQWKIYRSGVLHVIQATDSRLDEMKRVNLEPGEDKCTHHIEQTFKMQITSADQNLKIACFVRIDGGQTPDVCRSSVDLCSQTEILRIILNTIVTSQASTSAQTTSVSTIVTSQASTSAQTESVSTIVTSQASTSAQTESVNTIVTSQASTSAQTTSDKNPGSKSEDGWQEYLVFIISGIFALLLAVAVLLIICLKKRKATPPLPPPEPKEASEEAEESVEERADSESDISENESSVDFELRSEVDG